MQFKSTDLGWYVKKFFGIISYGIVNKVDCDKKKFPIRNESRRVYRTWDKENTELAEHETGIRNFKKGSEIIFNKIKNLSSWSNHSN